MFEDAFKGVKRQPKRKREKRTYRGKQSAIMREKRAAEADIEIPECVDTDRRARCEADPRLWLTTYLAGWFPLEFSENQIEIVDSLEESINSGGMCCRAMDRGGGKTTIGKGMTLKGLITGKIIFGFAATATSEKAKDEFIKPFLLTLETNTLLIADYPEVCIPFVELEGKAVRARSQTFNGERTFVSITNGIIFPTIPGSACSGSMFKANGLKSASRGAQHTTAEGDINRPDFIFFDDPQTDESAASALQTRNRGKIISSMVGMAGPGEKMSGYMACTVIDNGDLSSLFLDRKKHPEWFGKIYRMVNKWPDAKETLWEEYLDLRREDMENDDKTTNALDFYKANFEEMNKGAEVAWEARKYEEDLTAIQTAFHIVIEVGGWITFMAEYQNDPIDETSSAYVLTADIVASRCNGLARLTVPDTARIMTGFGDINYVGINFAVIAFKNDFTGSIVDYGKYPEGREVLFDPKRANKTTEAQAITQAIFNFVRMMADRFFVQRGKRVNMDTLEIDGNFMPETVHDAVHAAVTRIKPPFRVIVNRGRGFAQYKVPRAKERLIGVPGDHCHRETYENDTGQKVIKQQIVQDSDYWRMASQKALLLEPGIPGSLSLFGDRPRVHERISKEIAGEKLGNYALTDKGPMYKWNRTPGILNDLGDAVTGCYPAASILGASMTGGEVAWTKRKAKKPRRQCKQKPE